jgi:hypothetical protein
MYILTIKLMSEIKETFIRTQCKSRVIEFHSLVQRELLEHNLNNFIPFSFWIITVSITPRFVSINAKQMYHAIKETSVYLKNIFPFFRGSTGAVGLIVEVSRYHSVRKITLGRTPPDVESARRRDLCLTTHNTQKRETSMLPARFETAASASERPQTHVLERVAL